MPEPILLVVESDPATRAWLGAAVLTGDHVVRGISGQPAWPEGRAPYALETSLPGATAVRSLYEYLSKG